jgi:tRNA A22 N-methylase
MFVQADGLNALREPAQAISLLGMGGDTMCAILNAAPQKLNGAALILSPHTELNKVREVLPRIGYRIEKESIARSGGRFYVILQALPGNATYTEKEQLLGPYFIRERPPLFQDYLRWRQRVADTALKALKDAGDDEDRMAELIRLDAYIREELF